MLLCGVKGDENAPAKSLFWQPRKGLSYVLTFESERERNAEIMVARKHAEFPFLFLEGQDTTRATYAVVEQGYRATFEFLGVKSLGPRHILANLKELLRTVQSSEYTGT